VLVAEDNPVNRMVIEGMLVARGVAVDVAENGREAIERVRDGVYAAVFMDCQMPELDGYAATAGIRAAEAEAGGRACRSWPRPGTPWRATASAASRRAWTTTSPSRCGPRSSTACWPAGSARALPPPGPPPGRRSA